MSPEITALESQLAAAIEILQPFADDYAAAADMFTSEEDEEYMDICYNAYLLVTAWHARQSAGQPSTDAGLASIPPERAEVVARINQRHTYYLATIASRHERERKEAEDWYQRALNEALNSDENGI